MIKTNPLLLPTLMLGVFALLSMELGMMGVLPIVAEVYNVSVADAGWVVSIFALIVALVAPILPPLLTKYDAKKVLLFCLLVFSVSSFLAAFCTNFIVLLILRAIPAFFHPIFCAFAFSMAADSVPHNESPKAIAKIFIAVSAGMTLGVPLTSFIASNTSLEMSFIFFGALNALSLLATLLFIPNQKQEQKAPQNEQFKVLSKPILWASVIVVMLLNGAMFGFYSYMSEFLLNFTQVSFNLISVLLLIYGLSNVIGNFIAGKSLVSAPNATLRIVPLSLIVLYNALFFGGGNVWGASVILIILGIFAGIGNNMAQFVVTSPIPEAKELANGLFISAANIGITLGTSLCGLFISLNGSRFAVLAAVCLVVLSIIFLMLRGQILIKSKETK
ncbi:MFS transporter [Helicobacter sp. MIT 03-1614]|uniref:MFS transporter n=1 Tax=unclassified Helicobacter TaxID=2593540 RepID=UPI000512B5A3|nr:MULTISPECIES: MFS transporter [unclassified Helicobacter]TLD87140.1 MFS transporter [Helicobacter sp. MIT 03-1614]